MASPTFTEILSLEMRNSRKIQLVKTELLLSPGEEHFPVCPTRTRTRSGLKKSGIQDQRPGFTRQPHSWLMDVKGFFSFWERIASISILFIVKFQGNFKTFLFR